MDLDQARKLSGHKLASWRLRFREICWGHTDHLIKQVEGQYVDEKKKPKADIIEVFVLILLLINMIVLGIFDPLNPHSVRSLVAQYIDLSLSIIFFLEATARFVSFGYIIFTSDKWNLADLLVVILSFIASILEAAGIPFGNFTILRTVRVFRPLRTVTTLPAAKALVLSIYSAVKSLEDVTVLYILFIISFSIIGVTQFMGRLRTRCVRKEWVSFNENKTSFLETFPEYQYAENYTIFDFVCASKFEHVGDLNISMGCNVDATCNNAQFIGNRLLFGYTCPWGYDCLPVGNPMFGFVSFDSVPQAMLTIFVGVTAEGLYRIAYQMMDAFDVTAAYFFLAIHIFGTFFIVNLSVVLVTVTFEHVSSRLRDKQPKLVSKMQKMLQSGPRVLRKNRTKRMRKLIHSRNRVPGEGGTTSDGASSLDLDGSNISSRARLNSVSEEYSYLVPDFDAEDDDTRMKSLGEVALQLVATLKEEREDAGVEQKLTSELAGIQGSKKKEGEGDKEEGDKKERNKKSSSSEKRKQQRVRGATFVLDGIEAEETEDAWSKAMDNAESIKGIRGFFHRLLDQDFFETVLNVFIIINIGIMCINHYGASQFLVDFLEISNIVFACLFGLEFLIKVLHFGPKRYFTVPINVFDFVILVFAIVDVSTSRLFPSVTALRAIRLLKVMKSFPGVLRWTVVILVSVKSSFLLLCTIFVVNYCFATFGMHMFGGLFCDLATEVDFRPDNTLASCPNRPRANYDDVVTALLTTFQLMTGDNWDFIMYNSMRSRSWVVSLAYVGYVCLMTFVLVNILVGILLSGPSSEEVDLIGQKLFGISFEEKFREMEEEQEEVARARAMSTGSLSEWEESVKSAQKGGLGAHRLDLMGFAERTMSAVPQKFLDSLEAVEDTILVSEQAARSVSSKRRTFQRWLKEAMSSRLVENIMLLLLSVSSIALAFETPGSAPDDPSALILKTLDYVFSVLFVVEIGLNFYAFGMIKGPDSYLRRDPWNVLDAILVLTNAFGTSTHFFFKARWLQILLVVRAVRPLRFVKRSQGLRTVFTAFAMSIVPLKDVIFLALIIWTCWSLMGVQLFMGAFYSCSNSTFTTKATCLASHNISTLFPNGTAYFVMQPSPNSWNNADLHFNHLGAAFLSLLTLATLDGGADIMINGIDSVGIDIAPEVNHRQRVSFFFVSFVFIGGYFLVNLVVSVIIDTYNKEKLKNGDTGIFLTATQNAFLRSHRRLLHGVPQIFYDDHNVSDLRKNLRKFVTHDWFRNGATIVSLVNGCMLLADYYDAPTALRVIILICNFIFALVFSFEVGVKIYGLGVTRFFRSRFNQFDLFVTVCVFTGVIGEVAFPDRGFTFIFRAMRSISLFRVVRNAEKFRHVITRFSYSLYGLANVGALLTIFLYIFSVMGVKSFGLLKYNGSITRQTNFNNVFRGILLLLNALAGGGWATNMNDCAIDVPYCDPNINDCGVFGWSQAYFVLFIIFTKFILLNMFIAVILDSFVSTDFETLSISKEHVRDFFDKWMLLDREMTLRIGTKELVPFLRSLGSDNPLGFGGGELQRKIGHEFRFIQQLRLHEMDGTIELQDLITALCDATLGVPLPDSEIRALQKYADRKFHRKERDMYIGKKKAEESSRVIERFAAHVIEHHWIQYKKRAGRRVGKIGAQSILRSRAGEGDYASRRDNLSYVDQEAGSMYGGGRERELDDFDRESNVSDRDRDDYENNSDLDYEEGSWYGGDDTATSASVTGSSYGGDSSSSRSRRNVRQQQQRKDTSSSSRHRRRGAAATAATTSGGVFEARPQFKGYLKELAEPLVQAHERKKREQNLAQANIKTTSAAHHSAIVGGKKAKEESKEESEELMRLLVPHEKNQWYEESVSRLQSTLNKKEPLGGRRLHAQRVLEKHQFQKNLIDLEEAEKDFAEATQQSAASAIASHTSNNASVAAASAAARASSPSHHPWSDLEEDQKRKGLTPQTSLWQEHQQHKHRQQNQHTPSFYSSPTATTTTATASTNKNKSTSSVSLSRPNADPGHLEDIHELTSPVSRSYQHQLNPAAQIPGTYSHAGFSTLSENPNIARAKTAVNVLFSPTTATTSVEMSPIVQRAQAPQHSLFSGENSNNTMLSNKNNKVPSSPSAATSAASATATSTSPRRKDLTFDDIEVKMFLQELKEWKGEEVDPKQKVTRPSGYHKEFTADEYSSL